MTFVTHEELEQSLARERDRTKTMIDAAISGATSAQESRWKEIQRDLHSTVKAAVSEAVEDVEQRVVEGEKQLTIIRRDLYGDPNERSGPKSLHEKFEDIMNAIAVLQQTDQAHGERIQHYDRLERMALKGAQVVGNLATGFLKLRIVGLIRALIRFLPILFPWLVAIFALIAVGAWRFS